MKKRRFLVTGGAGFLGAALVRKLLKQGHTVRLLDDISRGSMRRLADVTQDIEFVRGDIRDPNVVNEAVRGTECVVHLAAVNGTEHFYTKPHIVLDVGLQGMLNIISACQRNGVGDLVVASSSEVYQTPPKIPTDETAPLIIPDPLNPRFSYAGSKIASELIAIAYGRNGFERVAIFRPHNVYGPDMAWEHVVPQFCLRAIDQIALHPSGPLPFPIHGGGNQTRAFINIDDMTDGMITVIEKGSHLGIYHVGNPEELLIADVARQVCKVMGREAQLVSIPTPKGSVDRRCPDITKLKALGFAPKVPFKVGLPPAVEWYVKNQHLRPVTA